MQKSITSLLTFMTIMGIHASPWSVSPSSAREHQTDNQKVLIASSSNIQLTDINGFNGVIVTLGVSPDGNTLIVASNDGQISAIDINNYDIIYSIPLKANPYSDIAFSSDGEFFAVAEQQIVYVYETQTGKLVRNLHEHVGNVSSLAISPDDRTLVSASGQDLTLKIWDLESGKLLQDIGEDVDSVSTVAFHPEGEFFVTGAGGIGSDRTIKYWELQSNQQSTDDELEEISQYEYESEEIPEYELVQTLPKQFGFIYDLTFDSNGRKLVGIVRNYVKIWDLNRNNAEVLRVKASPLELNQVAISPDGRLIATANREGKITMIDVKSKKIIGILTGHEGWIQTIAFSPDGQTLYSGAEDKIVKAWDVSTF